MVIRFGGYECIFIDLEASSLAKGTFPIEVGWSIDDEADPVSFLIKPHEDWNIAEGWSAASQAVHGISLEIIQQDGIPVDEACHRIDEACRGRLVLSDEPKFDDLWLSMIFDAADRRKTWSIGNVELLYAGLAQMGGLQQHQAANVIIETEKLHPHPHRAGPDALRMAKCARALIDPSARPGLSF